MTAWTRDRLLEFLAREGIEAATLDHEAVFRVGEGEEIKAQLPGGHSKNLFLKDAKGKLWLISALDRTVIDLKALPARIGSARLSFGLAELMGEVLGVTPGSVTPFALVNDPEHRVSFVLDVALLAREPMNFHPLTNTATTAISREGLIRFLELTGVTPRVVDFTGLG